MKLRVILGVAVIAALLKRNLASGLSPLNAKVPNILLNLDGAFAGQYQSLVNDMSSYLTTCRAVVNLNKSADINFTAESSAYAVNQLLRFSGPLGYVIDSYSSLVPIVFRNFFQIYSKFESTLGSTVTNMFIEQFTLLQNSLNKLIQGAIIDISTIDSNISDLLNDLEYLCLTALAIELYLYDHLTEEFAEVFIQFATSLDFAFIFCNYALFLLVPLSTAPKTLSYINAIVSNSVVGVGFVATLIKNTADNGDGAPSEFIASVNAALPLLYKITTTFMNSVRSVPNVLSNVHFSFQNNQTNLAQIQYALYQLTSPVGSYTGHQIFNIIISTYSYLVTFINK